MTKARVMDVFTFSIVYFEGPVNSRARTFSKKVMTEFLFDVCGGLANNQ